MNREWAEAICMALAVCSDEGIGPCGKPVEELCNHIATLYPDLAKAYKFTWYFRNKQTRGDTNEQA